MDREPDFHYEKGARRHAAILLTVSLLAIWFADAATRASGETGGSGWVWVRCVGAFLLISMLGSFVALAIKGGVFRVIIQDDRLCVQSPFRFFGPPFEMALSEIERLVRREQSEGPILYEIHAHSGGVITLPYSAFGFMPYHVADQVFATLHRLHPEIPIEWRP